MSSSKHGPTDYRAAVRQAVLDEQNFQGLTFSQPRGGLADGWVRVRVRPVEIQGERRLQFNYFTPTQCITKNYSGQELRRKLEEALRLPFRQIHVQSLAGDLHVRVSSSGRASLKRGKPSRPGEKPDLSHDRRKEHELALDEPNTFLRAVGIAGDDGRVLPTMQGKFRQVNEFLRVIRQTVVDSDWARDGVNIVDCGCGKAYLTFAAYHYLSERHGVPTRIVGIDVDEGLIRQVEALRDGLGWADLEFRVARIMSFEPEPRPNVVLSLHACDTATDEALARGVEWGSRVILAAPCCQHELHHALKAPAFRPVTRQGILRERLADILTDAFRAVALRIMGYRTSVIEFVDPEATAKNLMIRAEGGLRPWHGPSMREYRELAEFWDVEPTIGRLLGEQFQRRVESLSP